LEASGDWIASVAGLGETALSMEGSGVVGGWTYYPEKGDQAQSRNTAKDQGTYRGWDGLNKAERLLQIGSNRVNVTITFLNRTASC
jgi:hypothetical protein